MNEWIPVNKELPEIGKDVLVCDRDGDIYLTHRTQYNIFFTEQGDKIKGVKAWIDLPEPYKTDRDCQTCVNAKDGKCAGTEECHNCMWESQYKEVQDDD